MAASFKCEERALTVMDKTHFFHANGRILDVKLIEQESKEYIQNDSHSVSTYRG